MIGTVAEQGRFEPDLRSMSNRVHPPAASHGSLKEVLSDIFLVMGTIKMAPLMACSRNMVVVREGERLVLVNSLRLDDAGLKELDALGKVTDVVRLAGFHGIDDPFYKERYDAKVWNVAGMTYQKGFEATKGSDNPYFVADEQMTEQTELPLANARIITLPTTPSEGLLRLDRDGGVLISGDSLQNWDHADEYFSFAAKFVMKMMGFIKPHNLGPGWVKATRPTAQDIERVSALQFDTLLPAHGRPVIGGADAAYRPAFEAFRSASS